MRHANFLWVVAFLVGFWTIVPQATPAAAVEFNEELVAALAAKGFKDKLAAIDALGKTGDDRALRVLEALVDGNLAIRKSDKKVVIATNKKRDVLDRAGTTAVFVLRDPVTLEDLGEVVGKGSIKGIRANNKLRNIIRRVLGELNLLNSDPEKRIEAANAVFGSQSAAVIPGLENARDAEKDAEVKSRMDRALAANQLTTSDDLAVQIEAAGRLGEYSDPEVRALLASVLVNAAAKSLDETLRAAVSGAREKVEQKIFLWGLLGDLVFGVSLGSVLLLCAVGLAITFGVMGVINMAHGELMMLGAYTFFVVQGIFRAYLPEEAFDYSIAVAIPAAFLVAGGFGIAIERGIIRWLYGRPLETLLATWGLSLILQQGVRTVWGPTNQMVMPPPFMTSQFQISGGALTLTHNRMWILLYSFVVLALIGVILRKTTFGLRMRAVTQNRRMASSMGIRTGTVDALTFGLGSGVAGLGGVALSQIDNVSPNLGQNYIVDSFLVVVFGGVGNLWGTLIGAFTLGIVNKFLEPVSGAVLGKIFVLIGIIIFLQRRPRGLFALKGRFADDVVQ